MLRRSWLQSVRSRARPWGLGLVWLLASWTYPILGAFCLLSVFALQRLRLDAPVRASLRGLLPPLGLGIVLYWIQRIAANLAFLRWPGRQQLICSHGAALGDRAQSP
jgi:hypothetical protein